MSWVTLYRAQLFIIIIIIIIIIIKNVKIIVT